MTVMKTVTLNNSVKMPVLGLGVYQIPPGRTTQAVVLTALKLGYRLIDTAAFYGNEEDVGKAIKQSRIPRKEIFVTSKLHPLRCFGIEAAFSRSLKRLNVDYLDLYLIHCPFFRKKAVWKVLGKMYRRGAIRAIGVSNYGIKDLQELMTASNLIPTVNQVEFHPFLYNRNTQTLMEFCKAKKIILEAHSPLTHGKRLSEETIAKMAKKYHRSTAQILLRWSLQHGTVVIPKAQSPEHLRQNLDVFNFTITDKDMIRIDSLDEHYHAAFLSRFLREE